MLLLILFSYISTIVGLQIVKPGPLYPPTQGELWPKAQYENKIENYLKYYPDQQEINIMNHSCDLLTKTIERFRLTPYKNKRSSKNDAFSQKGDKFETTTHPPNDWGFIKSIDIYLTEPCEDFPYFGMVENYTLVVNERTQVWSTSIWGVMRAMESLSQLFYVAKTDAGEEIRINANEIHDYPRYPHRGLLLDTSRHYISVANILTTLDAMAINKLNVFHWHIVDDQSFPYQSDKFPELSKKGAYHPLLVYNYEDIKTVMNHARDLGIRVVPEFDVPGHTRSWGQSHPEILTKCYNSRNEFLGLGPMNPIKKETYDLVRELFMEVQDRFYDSYFHVGGDEVMLECWNSNSDIQDYMNEHNITNVNDLQVLFMSKIMSFVTNMSVPIVWQEVFDEGVPLPRNTIVHIWKNLSALEMLRILWSGHRVIYSTPWYLGQIQNEWWNLYDKDPRQMIQDLLTTDQYHNIVGGEACMWGEMVDDRNVLTRVWPRASAVAEVLWSSVDTSNGIPSSVFHRIEEHACRMNRRGIPADPPNGPGFCIG